MSNCLRFMSLDAVEKAKSGHPGMPMGMSDVVTVLFSKFIKIFPKDPEWPNRDRFILSAGHGSMLLYAINYFLGYEDMKIDEIKNFRQLNSITAGHLKYFEYSHQFELQKVPNKALKPQLQIHHLFLGL